MVIKFKIIQDTVLHEFSCSHLIGGEQQHQVSVKFETVFELNGLDFRLISIKFSYLIVEYEFDVIFNMIFDHFFCDLFTKHFLYVQIFILIDYINILSIVFLPNRGSGFQSP